MLYNNIFKSMGKNTLFPDLSCLGALKNALYWLFMGMWKDQGLQWLLGYNRALKHR